MPTGVVFAEQVSTGTPEGDFLTPTRLAGTKWLPPGYSGGRTRIVPLLGGKKKGLKWSMKRNPLGLTVKWSE